MGATRAAAREPFDDLLLALAAYCSVGGGSGGQVAKDALGNDIKASSWLATHQAGDRSLSQGLKVRAGRRQC